MVDPARVRFQHARIRPFFSGCGRSVEETLDEIRQGKMKPSDLPPIQVLLGPTEEKTGLPWYFSLNNRRLWVLKRCRDEGLLPNNQVYARVRKPKSEQEARRYTVENCALDAKIMQEKPRIQIPTETEKGAETTTTGSVEVTIGTGGSALEDEPRSTSATSTSRIWKNGSYDEDGSDDEDESDDERPGQVVNRFSVLF